MSGIIIGAASSETIAALTSKEKSADWLSAVGTWVVGLVGALLTWQVNRANALQTKSNDRFQRIEALAAYNQWMSKIVRLTTTASAADEIQDRLSINAAGGYMDVSDSVRKVMTTVDVGDFSNSYFIKDSNNIELFANLSNHRDRLLSACAAFLNSHPNSVGPSIHWDNIAMTRISDIRTLARSTSALAVGVRTVAENLRPPPVD